MKTLIRLALATLVLVSLAGCATKTSLKVEQKPGVDWSKYRTYAVLPMTETLPGGSKTIIEAVLPAIQDSIARGFEAKGYKVASPESADVVINVTAGWLPKVNVTNWNYVPGYVGSNWYGSYTDFAISSGMVQVDTFEQGRMAVQTYDAKTREMIWVGFGTAIKDERASVPERVQKIREAIAELLAQIPAAKP
ncbi:MAG: DUF4136 domain-containing protein [Opitutaceae bacterium]|nr:DUF4136 domain-containing protein [Opitutaceae bacterium]